MVYWPPNHSLRDIMVYYSASPCSYIGFFQFSTKLEIPWNVLNVVDTAHIQL